MSSEEDRKRYADKIVRDWAEKGKLIEGGWMALRQTILKDLNIDQNAVAEEALRTIYFLACEHLWSCVMGAALDEGREETEGDLRRMALIQKEISQFRLAFLAPHRAGRA